MKEVPHEKTSLHEQRGLASNTTSKTKAIWRTSNVYRDRGINNRWLAINGYIEMPTAIYAIDSRRTVLLQWLS